MAFPASIHYPILHPLQYFSVGEKKKEARRGRERETILEEHFSIQQGEDTA